MRLQKAATPALTHVSWSEIPALLMKSARFEGKSNHMTKLVECPVVERVPLLDNTYKQGTGGVLYSARPNNSRVTFDTEHTVLPPKAEKRVLQ